MGFVSPRQCFARQRMHPPPGLQLMWLFRFVVRFFLLGIGLVFVSCNALKAVVQFSADADGQPSAHEHQGQNHDQNDFCRSQAHWRSPPSMLRALADGESFLGHCTAYGVMWTNTEVLYDRFQPFARETRCDMAWGKWRTIRCTKSEVVWSAGKGKKRDRFLMKSAQLSKK